MNRLHWILAIIGCVLAVVVGWSYWPTLSGIGSAWLSNPDYTHGFFVVPISVWLLWLRRAQAPKPRLNVDWRGVILLIAAAAVRIAAGRFYVLQLDAWSIPIWVGGVVWLLFGWPTLRWALPSIAFLWFATPLPGTIEIILSTPLQQMAASWSASVLRLIGQPALVEGTTILLDDQLLDVERACSGLRMFYGIFALAVACIAIARPPRWKAVLVLFAAVPVAVASNVARITITGLLMRYFSDETARHFSHDLAGLVMIPLAVTLFLAFLILLGYVVERLNDPRGVAWLIKWCVAGVIVAGVLLLWGRHQEARALSTLLDTAKSYESKKDWPKTIQYLSRYVRAVPDDLDTYSHLARLYQINGKSRQDQVRAIELMSTAWKNQPKDEDLGISAIQLALQVQEFDDAIQICDEIISKASQPATRDQATKLRAIALYSYLMSDKNRGNFTWNNVREALEQELKLPDYDVGHVMILTDIYRSRPIALKSEERDKLATALLDRVVKERAKEPLAWLARFRYRVTGPAPDLAKASADLAQAVELAKVPPLNSASATVLFTAAGFHLEHANKKQAEELLEQARQAAPNDPRSYLMLAELKRAGGDKESTKDAIEILIKGVKAIGDSDPSRVLPLQLPLAFLQAESGQLENAEKTIKPIEELVPRISGRDRGNIKLGAGLVRSQIIFARNGAPTAIKYLREVLDDADVRLAEQRGPEMLAKGYGYLSQLYTKLGLSDLAMDALRQAIRIQPANAEWQLESARLAQQSGDLDSADRDFRQLGQTAGGSVDVRVALIENEINRQRQLNSAKPDLANAMALLAEAKQANPSNVPIKLLEAEVHAANGQRTEAEKSIEKLSQESPNEPLIWRTLAAMRLQALDTKGALAAAEKFVATSDQPIDAALLRANILASSGKADQAVKSISDVVGKASEKDSVKGALALARVLTQVGKPNDARSTLEAAHEKEPNDLQLVDTLANTAYAAQDWHALERYETWLKIIEGDDGTLWRAYRAQRLLVVSQSADDKDFQEAAALVDGIVRLRPRWSKSQLLLGEIAYRKNQVGMAVQAYERAWQYGGRGILLADRLIDLLTRQGKFPEANRYVAQVRDYALVSEGLFDRTTRFLVEGDDRETMARTARQWVLQRPNDPEAHLRFGRVLLLRTNLLTKTEEKNKFIETADAEFKRAIELSPNDVRPWAAIISLYIEHAEFRDKARPMLEDFTKQTTLNELERNFVAAQFYEQLNMPFKAQLSYSRAAHLLEANPTAAGGARVLGRAARFYLQRAPALSEIYARRTLALDPANADAMFALLYLLVNRTDAASAREGLRLLDDSKSKDAIETAVAVRYRAAFLSRRGDEGDVRSAIELLRGIPSQSREDKLLLARMYEQAGQTAQALDLLQQLVRAPNANAVEMAEFIQYWQKTFVANAKEKTPIQFAGQAREIYERLGELPGQLPERLRWQLRESTAGKSADSSRAPPDCMQVLSRIFDSQSAKRPEYASNQLVQIALIVLLQEKHDECAAKLVITPPNGLASSDLAIWLCHAYVTVPPSEETASRQKTILGELMAAYSKDARVVQAIGDCSFMAGSYQQAVEAYQRVIELRPDEHMARNNLALALVELQKITEARAVLTLALNEHPDDADLLDTQAAIEMIDNHADHAVAVLEKLVKNNLESPVLHFHLAVAYDGVKDKTHARESLFTATALGVQQRVLSPRDKKVFQDLTSRYLMTEGVTARGTTSASQASN